MKVLLIIIGLLTIVVGIVAAGFFFLGFYNVAAAIDDPKIVAWALPKVRDAGHGGRPSHPPNRGAQDGTCRVRQAPACAAR